mmetsp:Transcript_78230/g.155062  ORF Transcript_78230/g.155062 Transcript_78230/m.155062 type:complete len:148 (+) Transcript_78230:83-526(+)
MLRQIFLCLLLPAVAVRQGDVLHEEGARAEAAVVGLEHIESQGSHARLIVGNCNIHGGMLVDHLLVVDMREATKNQVEFDDDCDEKNTEGNAGTSSVCGGQWHLKVDVGGGGATTLSVKNGVLWWSCATGCQENAKGDLAWWCHMKI